MAVPPPPLGVAFDGGGRKYPRDFFALTARNRRRPAFSPCEVHAFGFHFPCSAGQIRGVVMQFVPVNLSVSLLIFHDIFQIAALG